MRKYVYRFSRYGEMRDRIAKKAKENNEDYFLRHNSILKATIKNK